MDVFDVIVLIATVAVVGFGDWDLGLFGDVHIHFGIKELFLAVFIIVQDMAI